MKASDFYFEFPRELIGLEKAHRRSASRLLIYDRLSEAIHHQNFYDLPQWLGPDHFLVVNETSVARLRFLARKKETGGEIEGLLLSASEDNSRVWLKGRVKPGDALEIGDDLVVKVLEREAETAILEIEFGEFCKALEQEGLLPIPPYIRKERLRQGRREYEQRDAEFYQTVFAKKEGPPSAAAPTASLHFDEDLIQALEDKGVPILKIRLQVGEGTFAPLREENIEAHQMHKERVQIAPAVWKEIEERRSKGQKLVGVGTTVVRSLEAAARREDREDFSTDLYIRPDFEFKMIDELITNFHWPNSTLILLVAAFFEAKNKGEFRHTWRKAYEEAIAERYRLFSFGDGMWIR